MGIGIVGGFAEKSAGRHYNSSFFITPGALHVHRKVHLFGKEKRIFSAGDGFQVHEFGNAKIGMMVCFDWFFPESCRTLMLKGAEIITHPANLVLPFWPTAAPTRAVENHVFIVTSSRIGNERGLEFVGGSLIATPGGEILSSSGNADLGCRVVEIDPGEARDKRVTPLNDIVEDRMPGAYELG
jgi:predicted amidohydrolase